MNSLSAVAQKAGRNQNSGEVVDSATIEVARGTWQERMAALLAASSVLALVYMYWSA
jgi:hypothetical protein